ncbi:MAG: hypothetical protein KAR31_12800, partial [Candidatus Omnitrophica bacterium]|nr:hypothetical protein [Candidatus Omnitrophota bacterium]
MDTGPPVVGSSVQTEIPEVTSLVIPQLQLPAVSSPVIPTEAFILQTVPMLLPAAVSPLILGSKQTRPTADMTRQLALVDDTVKLVVPEQAGIRFEKSIPYVIQSPRLAQASSPVDTRDPATWTSASEKSYTYPVVDEIGGRKYFTGIVNPASVAITLNVNDRPIVVPARSSLNFDKPIVLARQRVSQFKDFGKDLKQHQIIMEEGFDPVARVVELSDSALTELKIDKGIDLTQRDGVEDITNDMGRIERREISLGDSGNKVFVVPEATYTQMMTMDTAEFNNVVRPKVNAILAAAPFVGIRESDDPKYQDHKTAALKHFAKSPDVRLVTASVKDLNAELKASIRDIPSALRRAQAVETFERKFPGVTTASDGTVFVNREAVEQFSDYHLQQIGRGDLLASDNQIGKIDAVYAHEARVIANPDASYQEIIASEALKQPRLPEGITSGKVQRV